MYVHQSKMVQVLIFVARTQTNYNEQKTCVNHQNVNYGHVDLQSYAVLIPTSTVNLKYQ